MKLSKCVFYLIFVLFILSTTAVFSEESKDAVGNENKISNADDYFQKGTSFFSNGKYDSAINSWEKALVFYRNSDDKFKEAITLSNLGNAFDEKSVYKKAVEYYGKAIKLAEQSGNDSLKSDTLTNIGVSYWNLQELDKASSAFEEAALMDEKLQREESRAFNLMNSAKVYKMQGKNPDAISKYESALSIYRMLGNEDILLGKLEILGMLNKKEGRKKEALDNYLELIKRKNKRGETEDLGRLLNEVSLLTGKSLGESPEKETGAVSEGGLTFAKIEVAEDIIEEKIEPIDIPEQETTPEEKGKKQNEKKEEVSNAKYSEGIELEAKSFFAQATESYEEALKLWKKEDGKKLKSDILLRLGNLYILDGKANAENLLSESLTIKEEIKDISGKGFVLEAMGRLHLSQLRLPESMENFNASFAVFDDEKNVVMKSFLRIDIADSYLMSAMYRKAENYYEKALQEGNVAGNSSIIWRAKYGKAKTLYARKKSDEAFPLVIEAVGLIEKESGDMFPFLPDNKKNLIVDDIVNILIELYVSTNDIKYAEAAFLYSEISSYNLTFPPAVKVNNDIAGEHFNLLSLYSVRKNALIDGNEIFLKYVFHESSAFVFAVTKKEFQLIKLPLRKSEIISLAKSLISPVMKVEALGIGKWVNKSLREFDLDRSNKLYNSLIAPLTKHLEGKTLLMISSEGALSGFPFEALVVKKGAMRKDPSVIFSEYEDSRYLIDDYAVVYSPLAILLKPRKVTEGQFDYSFCAVGGEKRDIYSDLNDIIKDRSDSKYLNLLHKKDKLETIARCRVIQISAPLSIDFDNIKKSVIELEGRRKGNILATSEFVKNRNDASYLIISDFADDMVLQEESIEKSPLTASHFNNGVIYPLWNVNEKTRTAFLKEFIENLIANDFNLTRGEEIRFAKRKIKGTVLKTPESPHSVSLSHPYFWAYFIQSGR